VGLCRRRASNPSAAGEWTRAARPTSSQQALQHLRMRQGESGWAKSRPAGIGCRFRHHGVVLWWCNTDTKTNAAHIQAAAYVGEDTMTVAQPITAPEVIPVGRQLLLFNRREG
jgi:hypothetical protein